MDEGTNRLNDDKFVAISRSLAVIGSSAETVGRDRGAGQAQEYNATTGQLLQNMTSPNAQGAGDFGYSISMSGAVAIVGAPGEIANDLSQAGHAYIFE